MCFPESCCVHQKRVFLRLANQGQIISQALRLAFDLGKAKGCGCSVFAPPPTPKPALEAMVLDELSQVPVFGFQGCCVLEVPEVVSCAQHPIWAFMRDFILFISKNLDRNLDHCL